MKKIIKGFVITAVVMIVVGIGLFIGGIVSAGGISAARSALDGYEFYFDDEGIHFNYGRDHETGTTASEKQQYLSGEAVTFGTEDVRSLDLEIGAAQVEIVENFSAKDISVQTDGRYDIYVKNGVLHMESKKDMDDHTMRLEIPSNAVFESVEISVGACQMNIQRIETKKFDVEVGAGQVVIEDLMADDAQFEIGAGEIIVDYANVQECIVDVGMGNFEYNGKIARYGDIECGMGNAEIYLDGYMEDYNYEIECAAGNVEIDDESFSGLAAERVINNDADAVMNIECSMGNVTVGF